MIRHIVLFKIKDEYKDEIPQLVQNFYGMKGKIEGMLDLEAGQEVGIAASRHLRWGTQVGREAGFPPRTREAKGCIGGANRGQR